MRINETYEHDPLLSHQPEDNCPVSGCHKVSTQCVDVSAPVILTPATTIDLATITCQGNPTAACVSDPSGTSCTITFTQRICVSVPVCYSVALNPGDPIISCPDTASGPGCAGCH